MKVLVLGASGAIGKLVVRQLLQRDINIRMVIRSGAVFSEELQANPLVEMIRGNITEFTDLELNTLLQDCTAIVSCLGHNITFKGLFGNPRNLVFDTVRRITEVVKKGSDHKFKLILVSTTAYTNTFSGELNSIGEKIILSLLYLLLPPHRDNVKAANYLVNRIGNAVEKIKWIAVRPDTLVNADYESAYEVNQSTVRSPLFNAGTTSRINVSRFIAELLTDEKIWQEWQFKMPVIYNKE